MHLGTVTGLSVGELRKKIDIDVYFHIYMDKCICMYKCSIFKGLKCEYVSYNQ